MALGSGVWAVASGGELLVLCVQSRLVPFAVRFLFGCAICISRGSILTPGSFLFPSAVGVAYFTPYPRGSFLIPKTRPHSALNAGAVARSKSAAVGADIQLRGDDLALDRC